ncbi:ThiF family adenylyltransferase [Streptomyces sp. NPDC046939]|uniref:ThiF family adenylyltransferase n=1 Tax=Streptomyces sp. NPDC046939 TaxID=3155376 RepID=UPI0033CCBE9E
MSQHQPHRTRPRIKPTLPVYRVAGQIHIQLPGKNIELADENGAVAAFVHLLDGTRTVPEVVEALRAEDAAVTEREVEQAVRDFAAAGLLEDGAAETGLDAHHLERWKRNLGFLENYSSLETSKYELQRRMRDYRVVLLGLGGVGSHMLYDLVGLGVRDIRVVDFDTVELSNLNRQILYREEDIGRAKIEVAAERILAYDPLLKLDTRSTYIGSAEEALAVVEGRDLVLSAVDMPKMQVVNWINQACVEAGATLITGGVDSRRIAYYTMIPGVTGCVECWKADVAERDPVLAELSAKKTEWAETHGSEPRFPEDMSAFGALVTLYTAHVLAEVVRLSTGIAPSTSQGRLMEAYFDDAVPRESERWSRRPDCPVCSHLPASAAA